MVVVQLSPQEKAALLRQHLDDGVPLTRLAAHAQVSVRTLQRWAAEYRADSSAAGLHRQARSDRGHRRLPAELIAVIEALALRRPAPTTAFIHRRVCDLAPERGWAPPSYSSVRSVIAAIDPGLRTLALEGDTAYRDRYELVHRRTTVRPNEQWQADHTLLDVAILDHRGNPVRPWLSVILDDYSRAVAGYTVFTGAPNAEQTALALHQAVRAKPDPRWPVQGLPEVLYSDHGADFTSTRLDRVCLDTHIRLIHSRVGVPQGRGKIERFYGTITTEVLPHLPGHIPRGTGGRPTSPPALSLEQLDAVVQRYLIEDYHARVHSETGQAPATRWIGAGWIPRTPARGEDLDLLLLTAATTRIVQRDGIRFHGTRYICPVLVAYVSETVTIRYDPRDAGEVRVYHQDTYLCRAIAPELAAETITLQQLQQARSARRKELKQQLRARRSLADALPADDRWAPPPAPVPGPPADPPVDRAPRHRLRTYATD